MRKNNFIEDNLYRINTIYSQGDSLKEMKAEKKDQKLIIHAVTALHGHENHCELVIGDHNTMESMSCDCNWFKDYNNCPHLSLARNKIAEIKSFPYHYINPHHQYLKKEIDSYEYRLTLRSLKEKAEKSKTLLQHFQSTYDASLKLDLQEVQYEIEPNLNLKYKNWELSFKVGKEKKYVVKSIQQFLKQIDQHIDVSYGKNLNFVHSEEVFTDFAKTQISFMRKHMQALLAFNPYIDSNMRSFLLEGKLLDEFFTMYESEPALPFQTETIERSFTVQVEKKDAYYLFHFDKSEEDLHFGEKHLYTSREQGKQNIIQRICFDEEGITAYFLSQLTKDDIVISQQDYPQFYKYVLMTVMQYLDIDVPLMKNEEPMERAELYGDIDASNQIFFYLYCYTASNIRYKGFDDQRVTSYQQDIIESHIRKYATTIDKEKHIIYMDEDQESTLEFISEGLPYLNKYCDIFVSDALKSLGKSHKYHIQVGVRYSNELLSLDINSDEIPKEELAEVLAAYKRKKKFHRLKNGKLLSLVSNELDALSDFLEDYHLNYHDLKKGKTTLEPYRMFSLDEKAKDSEYLTIQREKTFAKHLEQYYKVQEYPIPNRYQSVLRNYQKEGFQWLSVMRQYNFNGILADDMGLGKTLQVIALLEANKSDQCSIVICPSSLIYNWEDEVHKFTDNLSIACISGAQEERKNRIAQHAQYDLLVTSYDYIRRDIDLYKDILFDTIILDEAQYIKNQKTKNALSVKQLQGKHKLALTGTPIENSLAELWSIFDFLMPDYLFNYHYFQKQYENDIVRNKDEQKQQALRKLVSPFILRRNKKEVLTELPDKIEKVRLIEFSEEERKLYLANVAQVNQELSELMLTDSNDKFAILAMLTRLRQICCEPRLVYENMDQLSSKLMDCLELIQELHENNQKILLFSSFTSILDLLAEELTRKQISFYQLTGKTNKEQRKDLVNKFQNDDTCVFLISLKAGGTGLNLTAAEAVIHFDPWWNQSAQNQATDRAYRIGQNKNVQVFKMIMKDSIEEKIMKLQEMKKELADAFVEHNEGSITSMSKEDIIQLFQP